MGKLGFTPIIGLAVVVALALAAVFGAMSLTNPAWAQEADPPTVSGVSVETDVADEDKIAGVINGGNVSADSASGVIEEGTAAQYELVFEVIGESDTDSAEVVFEVGDTFTITMDEFDVPSSIAEDRYVRIWLGTGLNNDARLSGTSLHLIGGDVELGDGEVTVTVPDFANYQDANVNEPRALLEGSFVYVVFGEEVGITTPENATTEVVTDPDSDPATDDNVLDTAKYFVWEVEGVGPATPSATNSILGEAAYELPLAGDLSITKVKEGPGSAEVRWSWEAEANSLEVYTWEVRYRTSAIADDAETEDVDEEMDAGDWSSWIGAGRETDTDPPRSYLVKGLTGGVMYDFQVRPLSEDDVSLAMSDIEDAQMSVTPEDAIPPVIYPAVFKADDYEPGKNSWYTLTYNIDDVFNGGLDTMSIKLEGFNVPSSISTSGIALEVLEPASDSEFDRGLASTGGLTTVKANEEESFTFNPASVAVDGKEIILTLPDVRPEAELTKKTFDAGSNFKVIIYQSAGVSNPTKANVYGGVKGTDANKAMYGSSNVANSDREIFVSFGGSDVSPMYLTSGAGVSTGVRVPRVVQLGEEDGGLGDVITATALGFQNGVTLHFFLDKPDADGNVNGMLDSGEDILCTDGETSSDHIGTCEFTVATPTFSRGMNYVNAVDGNGNEVDDPKGGDNDFELKASISVSPAGGAPGEIMQVQLVSFPTGSSISRIALSGDNICGGDVPSPGRDEVVTCSSMGFGSVGSQGTKSIGVTVPNWAVAGVQQLKLWAGTEDDDHKVTIVGPRIIPTPQTVVANQRVSLVGSGFSPSSELGDDTDESREESSISIGGYPIPWSKVNDGRNVQVDDGGNWSASLDLPLVEATTGTGERTIRITDSKGRTGAINVTLSERNFDITPTEGRVGTLAVVRGVGYPSKNDEGHSFTVDVIYKVQEGATARVSVLPDASGRFEVQLRIPTTASIPSTNQVEVTFGHEAGGTSVTENKQHFVPEGIISLSSTSGGPGTVVTLSGEGFKTYVPVESVKISTIEITPAPKPNTDANGMMSFDVLIPGLDVGIQTIEVKVGGTTSSTGFTVTESGLHPGNIVEVAVGLEDLGDNFVNIWHFNNDTKAWSFYDGMEGGDLTHLITGETYLLQIKSTMEVILNGDTRSVTCVGGNCWNQIVW